jgi:hypothetical protein
MSSAAATPSWVVGSEDGGDHLLRREYVSGGRVSPARPGDRKRGPLDLTAGIEVNANPEVKCNNQSASCGRDVASDFNPRKVAVE